MNDFVPTDNMNQAHLKSKVFKRRRKLADDVDKLRDEKTKLLKDEGLPSSEFKRVNKLFMRKDIALRRLEAWMMERWPIPWNETTHPHCYTGIKPPVIGCDQHSAHPSMGLSG
jgi:hypothetical protein